MTRPLSHFRTMLLGLLALPPAIATAAEVVFLDPNSHFWNVPANWSSNALPQPGDDVLIDAVPQVGTFLYLNTHSTISTLRILPSKHLIVQDGFALTLLGSSLDNQGRITLESTGSPTALMLGGNELHLSGGGTITMQSNVLIAGAGAGRLVNVNNRIIGEGVIGADSIGIENRSGGTIEARPGVLSGLTIDPSAASGLVNRGTMQASSGGILRLSGNGGGTFDNALGIIRAQDASQVFLTEGAVIRGGTLTTVGGGAIRLPDRQAASLGDLTNAGRLVVNSQGTLTLSGTIINSGSINLERLPSNAGMLRVEPGNEATLTGGGRVILDNALLRGRLINNNNIIEGSASIGAFSAGMVNHGIIRSTTAQSGFWIYSDATLPFTNTGTIHVSGGGITTLSGQLGKVFLNDGGRIEALPGSMIQLDSGPTIVGGQIGGLSGGVIQVQPFNSGTLENLAVIGHVNVAQQASLRMRGQIDNSGQIALSGFSNVSTLINDGSVTLGGSGVVTMTGQARLLGSGTLINIGNRISGEGSLGNNAVSIVNKAAGVIQADRAGGSLVIDPPPLGLLLNQGVLRVGNSTATMVLTGAGGGSFDSSGGLIEINSGTLRTIGAASLVTGAVTNFGTFAHHSTALATTAAIDGTGTINVGTNSSLSAARIRQSRLVIDDGGTVTIRAGGTSASTSRLNHLQIAGTPSSWQATLDLNDNALVIDYSGVSPIDTLRSYLTSGYAGGGWTGDGVTSTASRDTAGTAHPTAIGYAEASAIFGTFPATFHGQSVDSTSLLLAHTLSGDANLDGYVNLQDFNALAESFGQTDRTWTTGDFTYDRVVDLDDFNALAANFGLQAGPDGPTPEEWSNLAAAVPEPGSMMLVGLGAAALVRRRR